MINTIAIIGCGIVGSAIFDFFSKKIKSVIYDKYKNIGSLNNILSTDLLFICLPTPWDGITLDDTEIVETLNFLNDNNYTGFVIMKSTTLVGSCKLYSDKFDLNIIHNPEFLSELNSYNDFAHQDFVILGYTSKSREISILRDFFKTHFNLTDDKMSECTSDESESVKLMSNTFYSIKIQLFTEYYLLCQKTGMNYDNILKMMLNIGYINPTHTTLPYIDNTIGFHGKCLPKDTYAMNKVMANANTFHGMTETALLERQEILSEFGYTIKK